ncbi:MAG: hypothetical protein J0H75_10010, partial [Rhizobiales bacterium]|nr:hypothetical protein [Hyphomicrobiales bacterium]
MRAHTFHRSKSNAAASVAALTAADIYDGDVATAAYWRPAPRFQHVPMVHLLRDGENVLVTGPVEPRLPVGTEATQPGWKQWSDDVAGARIASLVASKSKNDARKNYFDERQAEKDRKFQEKCDRALAAGKPLPKRPESKEPPPGWALYVKNEDLIANMASARSALQVSKRMKRFRFDGGLVAGRETAPFVERFENDDGDSVAAIRSWLNIVSLALFSSALPKSGIIFGRDKTKVDSASLVGLDALFARDMPYIETDRSRRCLFVVDLDGWHRSIKALRRALRKLLPPEFMPNLIVYRGSETQGGVENPHLIWLLPPGSR